MSHAVCIRCILRAAWAIVLLGAFVGSVAVAQPPKAYLVKVDGMITQAYAEAVKRRLDTAREQGVATVILELNTPGGTVQDSLDLADYVAGLQGVNVVTYIHPRAYSGGTLLAMASKEIYIDSTVGMMGDVAPVGPTGEIVGEKIQTVIREKMASFARARGYPEALAKAMVTKEIEVYRVQMADDPEGAYTYVTDDERRALTPEQRDKIVREQLIVAAGQLLTMDAQKAVEYGFAKKAVSGPAELYEALGLKPGDVQRLYLTGSERLLTFLDMFSPLLIVAGFVLLFIEISHPGFGLPGMLGIACFVAFFVIKYTLHYARLLEILLFVAGVTLILIEVFLIPGFGVVGISGIALVFVSLVLAFQDFTVPHTPDQVRAFEVNLLTVIGSFAAAGVLIALMARMLPSMPLFRRVVLTTDLAAAHASEMLERRTPAITGMVGEVGKALTVLRPAGRAEFGNDVLDVVTEGDFVPKGARVQIVDVQGSRIVVKPYEDA